MEWVIGGLVVIVAYVFFIYVAGVSWSFWQEAKALLRRKRTTKQPEP